MNDAPTIAEKIAVTSHQINMIEGGEGSYKYRQGVRIAIEPTTHHKCGRCWRHLPEVTEDGALCSRCDHVVAGIDAAV